MQSIYIYISMCCEFISCIMKPSINELTKTICFIRIKKKLEVMKLTFDDVSALEDAIGVYKGVSSAMSSH